MNEGSVSGRSVEAAPAGTSQASAEERTRGTDSRLASYARRGIRSGAIAGVLGGVVALRGLRAFRRGDRATALVQLYFGGLLTAVAVEQRRRSRGRSEAATVGPPERGTSADDRTGGRESAADEREAERIEVEAEDTEGAAAEGMATAEGEEGDATAAEPTESEEVDAGETETGATDVNESETYTRMGEAAFDEESARLPVPQRAFDMEYLVLGDEAHWGIRETDSVVIVSQLYDPIAGGGATQYVGSTQVDDERRITIPDRILDHWEDTVGDGVAVESGDDVVFVEADELEGDDQLVVVPEKWSDEMLGADV